MPDVTYFFYQTVNFIGKLVKFSLLNNGIKKQFVLLINKIGLKFDIFDFFHYFSSNQIKTFYKKPWNEVIFSLLQVCLKNFLTLFGLI